MKSALGQLDRLATSKFQGKPAWVRPIMQFISLLGHPVLLTPIAFVLSVLSFRAGDVRLGYMLLLGCVAVMFNSVLKMTLRRARPDTYYARKMWPQTYSFPSGHSFTATVLFGIAAYYAYIHLPVGPDIWASAGLALLAFAVGYARIYLGAHYVLDVLGGWVLGFASLALLVMFAEG